METNTLAVLVVAIVLVVFLSRRSSSDALGSPPRPGGADGSPSSANGYEAAIGAAVGAGACAAGGAALGAPQLGAQLAPACAAVGGWAAPYVRKGVVAGAKGVATGATYAYRAASSGIRFGMSQGYAALEQPFDTAFVKPTQAAVKVVNVGATAAERALNYGYGKLPAPVKLATAPVVVPLKVTATVLKQGATYAEPVLGALSNGTKAATSAVTTTLNKLNPLSW